MWVNQSNIMIDLPGQKWSRWYDRICFIAAAKAVGRLDLVPHDMRRSAVRNFRKAGLSTAEGKLLSGHKTDSVYQRYNIIDEHDLKQSMERVQEHLKRSAEQTKVVPIRQAGRESDKTQTKLRFFEVK